MVNLDSPVASEVVFRDHLSCEEAMLTRLGGPQWCCGAVTTASVKSCTIFCRTFAIKL